MNINFAPSTDAVWAVPLALIFIFWTAYSIYKKKAYNSFFHKFYYFVIFWNLFFITTSLYEIRFPKADVVGSFISPVWYLILAIALLEGFLPKRIK